MKYIHIIEIQKIQNKVDANIVFRTIPLVPHAIPKRRQYHQFHVFFQK